MPSTTNRPAWGRGPLVVAGVTIFCLLAALVALCAGAVTDELLSGAIVAVILLLAALAALAVLAVLLVRDRFPREVLQRLEALEARQPASGVAAAERPQAVTAAPAPPPPATPTESAPPPSAAAAAFAGPAPTPEPPPTPALPRRAAKPSRPLSWELLLGGRGLAVVGGVVLLIAVALFVKFGWDQGWFRPSPAARVALGLAAGLGLLVLGELARRIQRYRMLAQALTAVGLGAVYVSVWAAHGLYHLVGASAALLLLAVAAAAGVAMAAATRGRFVAAMSTVGGLLAPVVVELPKQAPTALYVYLLVLLGGAAAVAALRRWPELGPIAIAGVAAQLVQAFEWRWQTDSGRLVDASFLLAAIVLLVAIALVFAWRRATAPGITELASLAVASLGGWGAGLARLEPLGEVTGGAWTVVVLLVELVAAQVVLTRLGARTLARWLFLALAGVFLIALPPVLWDGAWVAAAWAVEALALVAVTSGATIAGWAGAGVAVMAAFAALDAVDGNAPLTPFANLDWVLRGIAAAGLVALLWLVERGWASQKPLVAGVRIAAAPAAVIAVLAWLLPEIEAWTRLSGNLETRRLLAPVLSSIVLAVIATGLLAAWRHRSTTATWLSGVLCAVSALLWVDHGLHLLRGHAGAAALPLATVALALLATVHRGPPEDRRTARTVAGLAIAIAVVAVAARLRAGWPGPDVFAAGVVPAAIAALAATALLLAARRLPAAAPRRWTEVAGWITLVAAASRLLATALALAPAVPDTAGQRAALVALSVLWGGAGLALVLAGLAGGAPHRRHLGLGLLVVTVLKVFAFDLASAPTVLRIVAFLVTGLALLAGAWLYARYRERLEPSP